MSTTAFVTAATIAERTATATLTNKTLTSPTISGGSISGITDLAVADGGTGASTLAANNVLLGNGTSALQTVAPSTTGNFLRSNGTTWVSEAVSVGTGTVTSVATGNGLSGGTITSTGTLVIACPTFNTVGSYVMGGTFVGGGATTDLASGSNYAAGTGTNQIRSVSLTADTVAGEGIQTANNLSGTWKFMGASTGSHNIYGFAICCRVS